MRHLMIQKVCVPNKTFGPHRQQQQRDNPEANHGVGSDHPAGEFRTPAPPPMADVYPLPLPRKSVSLKVGLLLTPVPSPLLTQGGEPRRVVTALGGHGEDRSRQWRWNDQAAEKRDPDWSDQRAREAEQGTRASTR